MEYRKLGKTGIEVSAVAMGCWAIVGDGIWGEQDAADAVAAINTAYDEGVTFFDTAEGYGAGSSEEILGSALKGRRDKVVIGTKVSRRNLSADAVRTACEDSLRRLGTDYIDLYMIHWPSRETPFAETLLALEDLKAEGKLRAIGVSNFGPLDMRDILALGRIEANQLPYSLLWRAVEYEIQPVCVRNQVSITCYSPLMQGLLTGKFRTPEDVPEGRARSRHFNRDRPMARHGEDGCETETFAAVDQVLDISARAGLPPEVVSLAWLLDRPAVASVLVGMRSARQARANVRAAGVKLPGDVLQALDAATQPVKRKLGPNPDMWQSESRYR
ncbi:MAG: aldo/keto reductase [Planctomycetes bacterium]|nr:aldo/keto reductase [Planctomycetota bacterium]